jgi:anti-anti-sigma factor
MKVDVRQVADVIIVDLEGRLVLGVGDEILRDVMNELLAEDWKKILLNLREIRVIDSSGIGEVVSSWKIAKPVPRSSCSGPALTSNVPSA